MAQKRFFKNHLEKLFGCVLLMLVCSAFMVPGPATAGWGNATLTVNVSPAGTGNITCPQFTANPAVYPANFTCSVDYTLTAVPAAGYEFVEWVVNATTETDNPLPVSVAGGAKGVTAFFRQPNMPNNPPTADAGDDQSVAEGSQVALDGSGSSDPDGNGDIKNYTWLQTAGTIVALSNPSTVSPSFVAPLTADPMTLTFELTVEDIPGLTDTDTVTVTVSDAGYDPPTADAGDDQTVTQRSQVTLDASGSFDPENNITSYSWEQTEGVDVTLSDPSVVQPTFTAPEVVTDPITLIFKLIVADATGGTDEDLVAIIVQRGQIGGSSSSAGCFISGAVQ